MEQTTWLEADAWERMAQPADGRVSVRVVVDDDLGAIAEVTGQTGNRFYGVDQRRP